MSMLDIPPAARELNWSINDDAGLGSLADEALEPLFWRAERIGAPSAWWRHVPFAHWIVAAARPAVLVELGTHAGVSYLAFCQAVQRCGLATRCHAVDTWQGDAHAGSYDEAVFNELRSYHDARFANFSSLLRSSFDDALDHIEDGSIDLLHIDGLHTYEAVRRDWENWRVKLSDSAVVLFHDVNERSGDFGVWKLWAELTQLHPSFTFLHSHGLGVLAVGRHAPEPVLALCRTDDAARAAAIRNRFAMLGERWLSETNEHLLAADIGARLHEATTDLASVTVQNRRAQSDLLRLGQELRQASLRAARAEAASAELSAAHEAVLASTAWRITWPLRRLGPKLPLRLRRLLRGAAQLVWWTLTLRPGGHGNERRPPAPATRQPPPRSLQSARVPPPPLAAVAAAGPGSGAVHRIVYLSGEPDTPGHAYRVERPAACFAAIGAEVTWMTEADLPDRMAELGRATLLVIWRATWSAPIAAAIAAAREGGARVAFDIDDLMVDPDLARLSVIDGIRTQDLTEDQVRAHYTAIRQTLGAADLCLTTTEELAVHTSRAGLPTHVLRNAFDAGFLARSRLAWRRRQLAPADGLIRIGYAGGSRTHQRDFALCADAVADVLRRRPAARLVGFQPDDGSPPILDIGEFPALAGLEAQIEWRRFVPLEELPDEIARFDINLAPLETGNPFCEAKSELKYFEAALVDVPTIASPTGPFRRAIRHDETGCLAATPAEWSASLLQLVDDAALRRDMAVRARLSVLWRFGPEKRRDELAGLLRVLDGGRDGAQAYALALRQPAEASAPLPHVPPHRIAWQADSLGSAEVTVLVPLYNYADFVAEALDSVRAQSLAQIDLVIVDDCSTDRSLAVAVEWAQANAGRFNRISVLHNLENAGLAFSRNVGFAAAETPYVLPLDADNRLLPDCAAACLATIATSGAAFAYPQIQEFGLRNGIIGARPYDPLRLQNGNYIDAMALISRAAWAGAGGYDHIRHGWEDYDFWCRLVEMGLFGTQVPGPPLAEYRAHGGSMLQTTMAAQAHIQVMVDELHARHAWLTVATPAAAPSPPSASR